MKTQYKPDAYALVKGSPAYENIKGAVYFYQTDEGTVVYANISGLPHEASPCSGNIFGFHIHEGTACEGTAEDPFSQAMSHYDPHSCKHPYHAGDLPPLFGNKGIALTTFLTDRFTVNEIIGKTVMIHDKRDDFTTQPSGDSGTKIACGKITAFPQ